MLFVGVNGNVSASNDIPQAKWLDGKFALGIRTFTYLFAWASGCWSQHTEDIKANFPNSEILTYHFKAHPEFQLSCHMWNRNFGMFAISAQCYKHKWQNYWRKGRVFQADATVSQIVNYEVCVSGCFITSSQPLQPSSLFNLQAY